MSGKQNHATRFLRLLAVLVALAMMAAACGGDDGDDDADTGDTTEDTSDTTDDDGTGEDEEDADDDSGGDTDGDGDESSYLCESPTGATPDDATDPPDDLELLADEATDCDPVADRPAGGDPAMANAIRANRRASYPANVLGNSTSCRSMESFEEPIPGTPAFTVTADNGERDIFALYRQGEILTVADQGQVGEALQALNIDVLDVGTVAVDGLRETFAAIYEIDEPEDEIHLFRIEQSVDDEQLDGEERPQQFDFDPLVVSRILTAQGLPSWPNYVFFRTPGSQHSPVNEPVPADPGRLRQPATSGDGEPVGVVVFDSDAPATSPMKLSSGHMTFVSGVISQLTSAASIEPIEFPTGSDLSMLSDWELLVTVNAEKHTTDVDVLNLSLGAYTCLRNEPTDDPPAVADYDVPPGLVAAMTKLAADDVVVVAAAGNDGLDTAAFWPAAFTSDSIFSDRVVGVMALDAQGAVAAWSNKLPAAGAACALGADVRSHYPSGEYEYTSGDVGLFDGAAIWSGTSFATPHITAQLVDLLAAGESKTQAVAMLKSSTCSAS